MWQLCGAALLGCMQPGTAAADVFELNATGEWTKISPAPTTRVPSPRPAAPKPLLYQAQIGAIAARYNLSPALVEAVAWAESRHRSNAISPAGAIGVMQLMPETARRLGVQNPYDPVQNISGGAAYLRAQLDRFDNDLELALAAYNAGPGAVQRYGRVPPYRETEKYVRSILDRLANGVFIPHSTYAE